MRSGHAIAKAIPPNTALRATLELAEDTARSAGLGLWGRCGGADVPAGPVPVEAAAREGHGRPATSLGGDAYAGRTPGLRRRRPRADRQLRRPRVEPRRQRRRLRGAAGRRRHERVAHGPLPVGPRGRGPLPGRGRRRPPDPQRRARPLPLGPDHPGPLAARRRRRLPPHRRATSGTTPTSTRSAASCAPRSSGRSSGASTSATSTATWARSSSGPSSSTSTSTSPWSSGCPLRLTGPDDRAHGRLPLPQAGRRGGRGLPRPLHLLPGRGPAPGRRAGDLPTSPRASPRSTSTRRSTRPSCGPQTPDWADRVDDHDLVVNDHSLRTLARPGRRPPDRLSPAARAPARRAEPRAGSTAPGQAGGRGERQQAQQRRRGRRPPWPAPCMNADDSVERRPRSDGRRQLVRHRHEHPGDPADRPGVGLGRVVAPGTGVDRPSVGERHPPRRRRPPGRRSRPSAAGRSARAAPAGLRRRAGTPRPTRRSSAAPSPTAGRRPLRTAGRRAADAGEEVGLGPLGVDEAPGQDVLVVGVDRAADPRRDRPNQNGDVGSTWVSCASRASSRTSVNPVMSIEVVTRWSCEGRLNQSSLEGRLDPQLQVALVHGLDPRPGPRRVVQLQRLPRVAELRVGLRVAGPVERRRPRCRVPAGGRGAGSPAGRRRR